MDYEEDTEIVLRLPEDVHRLCRTCLSVSTSKIQLCHDILIFQELNTLTETGEMLQSCFSLKVCVIWSVQI